MGSTSLVACPLNDDKLNGPDHDYDHLIGFGDKEYQYTNEHCTSLRGKANKKSQSKDINNYYNPINYNFITMAPQQDTNINWPPKNKEELYILNEQENSYTGMNKQESRTARGAIEKLIIITAFLITKSIVVYRDILLICSNFTSSLVFPEPAFQQYKKISLVTKDLLKEIYPKKKEEDIHCLFVYWYFFIMFELRYFKERIDSRIFNHYIHIDGYYITPLMAYTLDHIYKTHRTSITESFEGFIKRALPSGKKIKDFFNKDDILKIRSFDNFDVTLLNKCINICIELCIPTVAHIISVDYKEIQNKCKQIKDIRNDMLHNLPKQGKIASKEYYKNLDNLEILLNNLIINIKKQFSSSKLDELIKNMDSKFFKSRWIPFSDFEFILILIIGLLIYYIYNLKSSL